MVTKERFAQGLTLSQYVDQMSVNRERFVEALDEVTIELEDARVLERLGAARRVLVITEDNQREAAKRLGLSPSNLSRLMKRLQIR